MKSLLLIAILSISFSSVFATESTDKPKCDKIAEGFGTTTSDTANDDAPVEDTATR